MGFFFHLIPAFEFCLPVLQDFVSLHWAVGLVSSISKKRLWGRGDVSLLVLSFSTLACSQGLWTVVMVHVMVLTSSETCSFGTHLVSFACIISKILPNTFFARSRLLSALSSHVSLELWSWQSYRLEYTRQGPDNISWQYSIHNIDEGHCHAELVRGSCFPPRKMKI